MNPANEVCLNGLDEVIETLEWGQKHLGHEEVSMTAESVRFDHCRTPGCFAGTFGAAYFSRYNKTWAGLSKSHNYSDHADTLARLILPNLVSKREHCESAADTFEGFLDENPLWGNNKGGWALSSAAAFEEGLYPEYADKDIPLQTVIDHLKMFRANVKQAGGRGLK